MTEKKNIPGIITLTTDFGLRDVYAGEMKGAALAVNPNAKLIDLSHDIPAFDIRRAAYVIGHSFKHFPIGTVHVLVVDPGVGGPRKILCAETENFFFLAPDNGILTLALREERILRLVEVSNARWFQNRFYAPTFHGRSIFAPVAAQLSLGLNPEELGPALSDICLLDFSEPLRADDSAPRLSGEIMHIDRFGNAATNISKNTLKKFQDDCPGKDLLVVTGSANIQGLRKTYNDVDKASLLALLNSSDYLEIACREASAAETAGLCVGMEVLIKAVEKK